MCRPVVILWNVLLFCHASQLERLERKFRLLEQEDKDIQSKLAAMEEEYALIHEAYMQEKRHQRQEEELEHKRQ